MDLVITEEEAVPGTEVDFYLKPGDKSAFLKTTINDTAWDRKLMIYAAGLNEWYPFYHFRKSTSTIRFGCEVTNPLDDLHTRLGI